jgi:hypothetical protein
VRRLIAPITVLSLIALLAPAASPAATPIDTVPHGTASKTKKKQKSPRKHRRLSIAVDPLDVGPGDTLGVDVNVRGVSRRDALIVYLTDDTCYRSPRAASDRGDEVVDDWLPAFVGSDLVGLYHYEMQVGGENDLPARQTHVCAQLYDGGSNRSYVTRSVTVNIAAGQYYG